MRRRMPRPISEAITTVRDRAAPKTPLAALQGSWAVIAGDQIADVASPVSEREGVITIECVDSTWAQELDLMQTQLLERAGEVLGEMAPKRLRFRSGSTKPRR